MPFDCFASLAMTEMAHTKISIVIASEWRERGNQPYIKPKS